MALDVAGKYAKKRTRRPEQEQSPRSWLAGIPQPTTLERAEGQAFRRLLLDPDNECLQSEYRQAFNALMGGQNGNMAMVRCGLCHTTKWGRRRDDACIVCKCKSGYDMGRVDYEL